MDAYRFDEVVERYRPKINNWCYRFTGDRDGAEDLAQDVLLRAYRKLRSFRGDSHIGTWLYAIARNHCANALRRRGNRTLPLTDRIASVLPDDAASGAFRRIEGDQADRERVRKMFDRLTPREAQVLWLHYGHEAPLSAVTQQLGLTNRSGAKAYIVSARRKLQS